MNHSIHQSINQPFINNSAGLWKSCESKNVLDFWNFAGPFYENAKSLMSPLTSWRYFEAKHWLAWGGWLKRIDPDMY